MSPKQPSGTLALIGGGEWHDGCREFDAELLARAGDEVVVLPTAAAFEHPERVVARATDYFAGLGASVRGLSVLRRADAEDRANVSGVSDAGFVYIADGSPLHLRSALKDSALFEAIIAAYRKGAVLAASGAGATVLCDPMVDPRGGAYTVGLGVVRDARGVPVPRHRRQPPARAFDRPPAPHGDARRPRRADGPDPRARRHVARRRRRRRDPVRRAADDGGRSRIEGPAA